MDQLELGPVALADRHARRTSRRTYDEITEGKLLSDQRLLVYVALYELGAATAGELADYMKRHGRGGEVRHMVSRRLPELRDAGVVAELGDRECTIGGRRSVVWQTTDSLPEDTPTRCPIKSADLRFAGKLLGDVLDSLEPSQDRDLLARVAAWLKEGARKR